MEWDGDEFVVRYVRLRDDLKPVEIYMGDPPEPINPDWVAITHGMIRSSRRPDGIEGFNLTFFMNDGACLTHVPFDTLGIAIDQAHATVGIRPDEWASCHMEIINDNGSIPWQVVAHESE